MKARHRFCICLMMLTAAACVILSGTAAPDGEESGGKAPDRFKVTVKVNMVNVPVTVRHKEGGFVKGLPQEAFRVYEDGVPQDISIFAQEGLPTHIAIVLDISGSVNTAWGTIRYATLRFIEHLHPDDRFSLYTFNTQTRLKKDWEQKADRMDEVLGSIYCNGNTKVWDTVWLVSREGFKGIEGKKAVIIMSDGMDNRSSKTYDESVEAAVRSEAAVYVVSKTEALKQMYEYLQRTIGGPYYDVPPEVFARADLALRNLADKTGGRVLYPNSFGQLNDVYAEVIEELRNQYTIGYISNNPLNDGSYRNIEVRVNAENATVSARPGYYAPNEMPAH
jgi:Ca-activated chloride channel family protein